MRDDARCFWHHWYAKFNTWDTVGDDPLAVELGRRVRALRGRKSQASYAAQLGVSQNSLSRIERGLQGADFALVCRVSARAGLSLAELLEDLEAEATKRSDERQANRDSA